MKNKNPFLLFNVVDELMFCLFKNKGRLAKLVCELRLYVYRGRQAMVVVDWVKEFFRRPCYFRKLIIKACIFETN